MIIPRKKAGIKERKKLFRIGLELKSKIGKKLVILKSMTWLPFSQKNAISCKKKKAEALRV
jgi:hypothetical protein